MNIRDLLPDFKTTANPNEILLLCPFHDDHNYKLGLNTAKGIYQCWSAHCGAKGTWKQLAERLKKSPAAEFDAEVAVAKDELTPLDETDIRAWNDNVFKSDFKGIYEWFVKKRGFTEETIREYSLGWNGRAISIPIPDAYGKYVNVKFRRDPTRPSDGLGVKYWGLEGRNYPRMYPEDFTASNYSLEVIFCEGELDCILLRQMGFMAITTTGGVQSFREEWAQFMGKYKRVYLCFDNDLNGAGQKSTEEVGYFLSQAGIDVRVIHLSKPSIKKGENKSDVTSWIVGRNKSREDFEELISEAKRYVKEDELIAEKETIYTSFLETSEFIAEQIQPIKYKNADDANVAGLNREYYKMNYVLYSKLDNPKNTTIPAEKIDYAGKRYFPIVNKITGVKGVKLPSGVKEYKDTKEIVDQIRSFISKNVQLPTFYEKFLPYLILFYWVYEKFPFIPYLHFVGRTTTGKTTAMMVIGELCYKCIETTGSLTIASMFRISTDWGGTLLIDEFDTVGENTKEITMFLKAGVSDKLIFRTEGEGKKEVTPYVVKSPKLFTSEKPISDAGLQSRTIVIPMQESTRQTPLYFLPDYYKEADEIRNKLLLWRLRNLDKIDLSKIQYGFDELKVFDRRVQQIITPIYYLADEESRKDIIEFAKAQEIETLKARQESIEGRIFEIIYDIWELGNEAKLQDITTAVNEEGKKQGYRNEMTEKRIGHIVRKVLGFETERRGHEKTAWIIRNEKKSKELKNYYGLGFSRQSSATSASSANDIDSLWSDTKDTI